jgi:hypothetical protein
VSTDVRAAWEAIPDISMIVEGDDNPRFLDDRFAESDIKTYLEARLRAVNFTERSEFRFEPAVSTSAYGDELNQELESTDYFLGSRGRYAWEKAQFSYFLDLSQQSVLEGELIDAAVDDPDAPPVPGTDTGRVLFFNQDVERAFVRPTVDFQVAELTRLVLSTQYSQASYSGAAVGVFRSDFSDHSYSIGLQHRPNQINTMTAQAYVSDYSAEANNNTTQSTGVTGTFSRRLSQTLTFALDIGVVRTKFTFDALGGAIVSNSEMGNTINLSFRQRSERTTLNFDAGRYIEPNGNGFVVNRDQLRLSATRELKPRLSGTAAILGQQTRTVGDVATSSDRDYGRLQLGLEWAMTERWFLLTGYTYTYQKFELDPTSVDANAVYIGVNYSGLSRRTPR